MKPFTPSHQMKILVLVADLIFVCVECGSRFIILDVFDDIQGALDLTNRLLTVTGRSPQWALME